MNWKTAKDAAWRKFGTRWWKAIVALDAAGRALPYLLAGVGFVAVGWLAWWVLSNAHRVDLPAVQVPGPSWWVWAAGGLLVLSGVVVGVVRARDPYRLPWKYRRGGRT